MAHGFLIKACRLNLTKLNKIAGQVDLLTMIAADHNVSRAEIWRELPELCNMSMRPKARLTATLPIKRYYLTNQPASPFLTFALRHICAAYTTLLTSLPHTLCKPATGKGKLHDLDRNSPSSPSSLCSTLCICLCLVRKKCNAADCCRMAGLSSRARPWPGGGALVCYATNRSNALCLIRPFTFCNPLSRSLITHRPPLASNQPSLFCLRYQLLL